MTIKTTGIFKTRKNRFFLCNSKYRILFGISKSVEEHSLILTEKGARLKCIFPKIRIVILDFHCIFDKYSIPIRGQPQSVISKLRKFYFASEVDQNVPFLSTSAPIFITKKPKIEYFVIKETFYVLIIVI